jgi:hypothetical protein
VILTASNLILLAHVENDHSQSIDAASSTLAEALQFASRSADCGPRISIQKITARELKLSECAPFQASSVGIRIEIARLRRRNLGCPGARPAYYLCMLVAGIRLNWRYERTSPEFSQMTRPLRTTAAEARRRKCRCHVLREKRQALVQCR